MQYLNIHQLSEKLAGRSSSSIYTDVNEGRLPPPIKFGNRNIWPEPVVDDWIINLGREQGVPAPASFSQTPAETFVAQVRGARGR